MFISRATRLTVVQTNICQQLPHAISAVDAPANIMQPCPLQGAAVDFIVNNFAARAGCAYEHFFTFAQCECGDG